MIDAAAGDPAEAFEAINHELEAYGAGLAERPQAVVLNKIDLLQDDPDLPSPTTRGSCACSRSRPRPARASRPSGARSSSSARRPSAPSSARTGSPTTWPTARSPTPAGGSASSGPTAASASSGRAPSDEELEQALKEAGARVGDEVEVEGEVLEFQ